MEDLTANRPHDEEELNLKQEFLQDLSSKDVLIIVVPLVFNFSLITVWGYFEQYINQYLFHFLMMSLLWTFVFFLKPKEMARIKFKVLLLGIGVYLLTASGLNWIWLTIFDSATALDNISTQFLIFLVNAVSFFLVWSGFRLFQQIPKP